MIIYRGYGWIGFIAIGLGVALGVGFTAMAGGSTKDPNTMAIGAGFVGMGLLLFGLGWWLNMMRPEAAKAQAMARFEQEASRLTSAGKSAFPASTVQVPGSLDARLAAERAALEQAYDRTRNLHTLFFIPIQWWGLMQALGGAAMLAAGILN